MKITEIEGYNVEYFDIVDEDNNLTGKTEERNVVHEKGIWHREVAVWIMNENGEILIQKRAANKKQEPNKWAICAGHIDAGETVESAIIRELEEELGIKVGIEKLEFISIYKKQNELDDIKNYNFQYMYFLKTNLKIENYKIQLEELSDIKYIPFTEFEDIVKNEDQSVTFSKQKYMTELIEILRKKI